MPSCLVLSTPFIFQCLAVNKIHKYALTIVDTFPLLCVWKALPIVSRMIPSMLKPKWMPLLSDAACTPVPFQVEHDPQGK